MKVTASNNPFVILYQAMWYYSRGFRWMLPVFLTLCMIGNIMSLSLPYFMGKMINQLQLIITDKNSTLNELNHLMVIYALLGLGIWVFFGPGRVVERRFAVRVQERCYNELYQKIQALPLSWHQDHHSGNLISRLSTATEGLLAYTETQFITMRTLMRIIIPIGFLIHIAWPLAITSIFTLSVFTIIARLYDKVLLRFFVKRREIKHALSALVFDYISNIQTIITLRLGIHTQKEIAHRLRQQKEISYPEGTMIEYKWATIDTLVNLNRMLSVFYMIWLFRQGMLMEIGLVVMVMQYVQAFSDSFFDIGSRYETIQRQANDVKATALIHAAYDALPHHGLDDDAVGSQSFTTITIDQLNFAYSGGQAGRVDNVSLTINKGDKIAFVGASGSGKSTTMKLLRVLYPVQGGTLTIDGVPQDDFEPLKEMTTLIPQEPEIFENTIRYNITMGVEHDDASILEACRIACFDTVLQQLPQGLDTDIREKGVNLSGGQKQRLALARGVFAIEDSEIILLDEPTSSVDSMTEQRIYNNLMKAYPDKVLISSIHRLHMLTQFNKIYVFEQGQIVQSGTLNELLQQAGSFKAMYQAYQMIQDQYT